LLAKIRFRDKIISLCKSAWIDRGRTMARVRRNEEERSLLLESEYLIKVENKVKLSEIFVNDHPVKIEIGMGRGTFVYGMAEKYPDVNFIGIDVVPEVIYEGILRMEKKGGVPSNVRFLWLNAENIDDVFGREVIDGIYLNFSDPWPKKRHNKRRLTHENFLKRYEHILKDKGTIEFKTDGKEFFEFSLNEFARLDWKLSDISLDLYRNLPQDNVATEYEQKFVKLGLPIYKLVARKR